jgi:hypothetical protein
MTTTMPVAKVDFNCLGSLCGATTNRYNLFSMHFAFIKNWSSNLSMLVQAKGK